MNNEKKMNNNGFSLVELIIVIAIMAVLIGVLAPQYLKYVERSRNSTDRDNAAAIENALQVWGSETEVGTETAYAAGDSGENTFPVSVTSTKLTATGAAASALRNAGLLESGKEESTTIKCASKTTWKSYKVTATLKDGVITTKIEYYASEDCTGTPINFDTSAGA